MTAAPESDPSGKRDPNRAQLRTDGFRDDAPTPKTPSTREGWDAQRHADALEFHRKQNERPGTADAAARRNQYCPKCRGVVDWKAEKCPHCGAAIETQLRDYYNFSDFEAPVDRREIAPILTAFGIAAAVLALLVWGVVALIRAVL